MHILCLLISYSVGKTHKIIQRYTTGIQTDLQIHTQAPFTQPVQGENVAPLIRLTVLLKRYKQGMGVHYCSSSRGSHIARSMSV